MKTHLLLILLLGNIMLNADKLSCIPVGYLSHNTQKIANMNEQEAVNGSFALDTSYNKLKMIKNTNSSITLFNYNRTHQGRRVYCNSDNICMHLLQTGKSNPKVISYIELYLDNQPKALVSFCNER